MHKIFFTVVLVLTMLTATAFAAEKENDTENQNTPETSTENKFEPYEYTSETYGFKITCPSKPAVVVKPFEDPNKKGEMLVFANDGMKILFGYIIELDAFDNMKVPDFNSKKKELIDSYVEKKREDAFYNSVELREISKNNKGLVVVTAKVVEVADKNGNVINTLFTDEQTVFAYFRSKSGRCISIQLLSADLDKSDYQDFLKSVSTYQDATDLSMPQDTKDKKAKDKKAKKDKKSKKDKK